MLVALAILLGLAAFGLLYALAVVASLVWGGLSDGARDRVRRRWRIFQDGEDD